MDDRLKLDLFAFSEGRGDRVNNYGAGARALFKFDKRVAAFGEATYDRAREWAAQAGISIEL